MSRIRPGAHRPTVFGLQDYPVVWGVYLGNACVSAENPLEWIEVWAHAHNDPEDEWFGWICIRDAKLAFTKRGNPSLVMKHEVAHLLVPKQGHTRKWRETLTSIGGAVEARKYEKRELISQHPSTKISSSKSSRKEEKNEESLSNRIEFWSPRDGGGVWYTVHTDTI